MAKRKRNASFRRCDRCQKPLPDSEPINWVRQPGGGKAGIAWCNGCLAKAAPPARRKRNPSPAQLAARARFADMARARAKNPGKVARKANGPNKGPLWLKGKGYKPGAFQARIAAVRAVRPDVAPDMRPLFDHLLELARHSYDHGYPQTAGRELSQAERMATKYPAKRNPAPARNPRRKANPLYKSAVYDKSGRRSPVTLIRDGRGKVIAIDYGGADVVMKAKRHARDKSKVAAVRRVTGKPVRNPTIPAGARVTLATTINGKRVPGVWQVIRNPGGGRVHVRGNVAGRQGVVISVPLADVRRPNPATIADAKQAYTEFHWGITPKRVTPVRRVPNVGRGAPLVQLGKVHAIAYSTHKRGDGHAVYEHKFGEGGGRKPALAADERGDLHVVGGTYSIEDRGIVG